jgi:hypothetical protein
MRQVRRALVIATLVVASAGAAPAPPLLVVLPDGAEVGATLVSYEVDTRRVFVIDDRVFVDDFED